MNNVAERESSLLLGANARVVLEKVLLKRDKELSKTISEVKELQKITEDTQEAEIEI